MGNISKITCVVVGILIGSACHAPEPSPVAPLPPSTVTIRGGVGNQWFDGFVATVEVVEGPVSGLSTVSDVEGTFELTGPFGGTNVTLRITANGYTSQTATVTVDRGGRCSCFFTMFPSNFHPVSFVPRRP